MVTPENASLFTVFYKDPEAVDLGELISNGLQIISLLYGRKGNLPYEDLRMW